MAAGSGFPDEVTVTANGATVLFRRTFGDDERELVVYRLDEHSNWLLVRRLAVSDFGLRQLALPDGTVFVRHLDPQNDRQHAITAYPPAGEPTVVWREANAGSLRSGTGAQLLAGPR